MPLILRLDIDKPYGRASFKSKVLSKAAEDFYEFKTTRLGYLAHLTPFFDLLDKHNVSSYVYFRNCCLPPKALVNRLQKRGDVIGFHAEDTRTEESFMLELKEFSERLGIEVTAFSKHGSGKFKLGKRHYAPYEETKYKQWAKDNKLEFYFGNGMTSETSSFDKSNFYPDMFWVEPHYRDTKKFDLEWIRKNVKSKIIPVITHPENIYADKATKDEFLALISEFSGDFISPSEYEKTLRQELFT